MTIERTFENSEEARNGLPGFFGKNVEITTNEGVYKGIIRSQGSENSFYEIGKNKKIYYTDTKKLTVLEKERNPCQNI